MPKMNKEELRSAIQKLGETPPSTWGVTELTVRYNEILVEKGISVDSQKKMGDTLQARVSHLSLMSKNKGMLRNWMEQELGAVVHPTDTIAVMQKAAMQRIYLITPARSDDPVG